MRAHVPVTPGYLGADSNPKALKSEASASGIPYSSKPFAGGGGKGMRRVEGDSGFDEALASCRREAAAAFGDDRVLIEKYHPVAASHRVQVFGDTHGQIRALFERDCSLQRRHQKVIEEAPAPGMDAETREFVCSIRGKGSAAVNTWVRAPSSSLRMPPRAARDKILVHGDEHAVQVEHPVTEAITGQDLVEWQLASALRRAIAARRNKICGSTVGRWRRGCTAEIRRRVFCRPRPSSAFSAALGAPGRQRHRGGRRGHRLLRSDDREMIRPTPPTARRQPAKLSRRVRGR